MVERHFINTISKAATIKEIIDKLYHVNKPNSYTEKKNPKRQMTNWENISSICDKILVTLTHNMYEYYNQ